MNHTSVINIWQGTNRVSRLWEELLADRVSPDPLYEENTSSGVAPGYSFLLETPEMEVNSSAATPEQNESTMPTLLEREGFESLRWIKNALDILSAPPEEESTEDAGWNKDLETLPAGGLKWGAVFQDPFQASSAVGLTFVKVSSEPEPQPSSAIDTRRMAYGLKIPNRPLHKRPIYQRIFFCLQQMMSR